MSFGHQGLWGIDSPALAGAVGALVPRTRAHQAEGCLKPLLSVPSRSRCHWHGLHVGRRGAGGFAGRLSCRGRNDGVAAGSAWAERPGGLRVPTSGAGQRGRRSRGFASLLFVEWRSKQEDGWRVQCPEGCGVEKL